MKNALMRKVLAWLMTFTFVFQQTGFAQGVGQLQVSKFMNQLGTFSGPEKFRPLHLRYFSYNPLTDDFRIILDKGSLKKIEDHQIKTQAQELLKHFLVGVALPDESFWVNLRPDSENQIIDQELAKTDLGKVLLEADLQLKKDTAKFTSPETLEGREYWDKLYKKAGQIFASEPVTIPTLTRPWIVPGEVIIRETKDSAYIYKATLKVMLEQDYLKNSADYNFSDPRLKELNEYSSQLIRQKIIPKLTKEINTSAKYASLRQVFYSLILSRWFKNKYAGKTGLYSGLINSGNLKGLTSRQLWSKTTYFKEYQKSFTNSEYNVKEQVHTVSGPIIRTYCSGGIALGPGELQIPTPNQPVNQESPVGTMMGNNPSIADTLSSNGVTLTGKATSDQLVLTVEPSGPVQIRTELTIPDGQPKGFFTNDYHSYNITELLTGPIDTIPEAIINAVKGKLDQDIAEGKILSAVVNDFGGTDIDIHVTHRYGELNAAVQRLILEAIKEGCLKARELGLLRNNIEIDSLSLADLAKALRLKYQTHSIIERGSEPVVMVKIIGAGIGAANIKLYHEFFMPGSTPLQKLGFVPTVGLMLRLYNALFLFFKIQ